MSDIEQAAAQTGTVDLPDSIQGLGSHIADETAWQLAVHQFTAEFAEQVVAFFGRYAP